METAHGFRLEVLNSLLRPNDTPVTQMDHLVVIPAASVMNTVMRLMLSSTPGGKMVDSDENSK